MVVTVQHPTRYLLPFYNTPGSLNIRFLSAGMGTKTFVTNNCGRMMLGIDTCSDHGDHGSWEFYFKFGARFIVLSLGDPSRRLCYWTGWDPKDI